MATKRKVIIDEEEFEVHLSNDGDVWRVIVDEMSSQSRLMVLPDEIIQESEKGQENRLNQELFHLQSREK